jgi:serine protease
VASSGQAGVDCGDFTTTSNPTIRFNDVFAAGGKPYAGSCTGQTGKAGNISADPLFVAPAKRNYHISAGSPAIDAGDNNAPSLPATDFDRRRRIQDGDADAVAVVDMGIDEFTPPQASETTVPLEEALADNFGYDYRQRLHATWIAPHGSRQTGADQHTTVFAYDTAGRVLMRIDATGMKHDGNEQITEQE